jgi:hypothetical protein
LLGLSCCNALQYLALQTSTLLNVTLVAASGLVWMLGIGALFFQAPCAAHLVGQKGLISCFAKFTPLIY